MHMHEVDAWFVKEEMIVQRGDLNAVIEQSRKDGIDFVLRQDKVSHQNFCAAVTLCHGDPATKAERRGRGLTRDGHVQIIAWDVDLQHVGFKISAAAEKGENFLVVLGHILGGKWIGNQHKNEKAKNENA